MSNRKVIWALVAVVVVVVLGVGGLCAAFLLETGAVHPAGGMAFSNDSSGVGTRSERVSDSVPAGAGGELSSVSGLHVDTMVERSGERQEASLKAGAIDDNSQWRDYLAYLGRNESLRVHHVDVSERYVITVLDVAGAPVHGALVKVGHEDAEVWQGRSYADGRTLWMPGSVADRDTVSEVTVTVEIDGMTAEQTFAMGEGVATDWELRLDQAWQPAAPVPLDVVYLIDATGSMTDEIGLLKETLAWVAGEIQGGEVSVDLRMGMVAYRDRDEEFVTEVYELGGDVEALRRGVKQLEAEGGGDTLESLNEGLYEAVSGMNWRAGDAVKLVFLVADAGPHLDYDQDRDYAVEMRKALSEGIKVHTVATSGLQAYGEYVFRQVAQHTMGTFVFLVYGGFTTHDVGQQFSEENLDQLIVDLVLSEVEHLGR